MPTPTISEAGARLERPDRPMWAKFETAAGEDERRGHTMTQALTVRRSRGTEEFTRPVELAGGTDGR
jgi:hypothetical protein